MDDAKVFKTHAEDFVTLVRDNFRAKSKKLRVQLNAELEANQHNYESGAPLEDFFREQFGELFHYPYAVDAGKIVDHEQYTCGDCDFIIYDPRLAPLLKPPATAGSRRKFFAFETTYGIIEVKQTLTLGATAGGKLKERPSGTLYDACAKIFSYKQLSRARPAPITWGINYPIGVAFFYASDVQMDDPDQIDLLLHEFKMINSLVAPEHRVNGVYVLDQCALNWSFAPSPGSGTFLTLQHPIELPRERPPWLSLSPSGEDTLYRMFTQIWSTLARTQLAPPDLLNEYGGKTFLGGKNFKCIPVTKAASAELRMMRETEPSKRDEKAQEDREDKLP